MLPAMKDGISDLSGRARCHTASELRSPASCPRSSSCISGALSSPSNLRLLRKSGSSPNIKSESTSGQSYRRFSRFCRDVEAWQTLSDKVLFPMAKVKSSSSTSNKEIRCWSCGCSTGQEVYYLRMIWRHRLAEYFPDVTLSVLGTDLNEDCVAAAREAIYPHHSIEDLPSSWVEADFHRLDGEDESEGYTSLPQEIASSTTSCRYQLRKHARCGAAFELQDAQTELPPGSFDIVLTRYALCLYLPDDVQVDVLSRILLEKMRPGACLMIGSKDNLPQGITNRFDLKEVNYDRNTTCPIGGPRWARKGIFMLGPPPPEEVPGDSAQTLCEFLRSRKTDVDWLLESREAKQRREEAALASKSHTCDGSKCLLQEAISSGRRFGGGFVDRQLRDFKQRCEAELARRQSMEDVKPVKVRMTEHSREILKRVRQRKKAAKRAAEAAKRAAEEAEAEVAKEVQSVFAEADEATSLLSDSWPSSCSELGILV